MEEEEKPKFTCEAVEWRVLVSGAWLARGRAAGTREKEKNM